MSNEKKYMSIDTLGDTSEKKIQEDVEKYKHMLSYEENNIESFGLYKHKSSKTGKEHYWFYVNFKKPVTSDEIVDLFPFPTKKEPQEQAFF